MQLPTQKNLVPSPHGWWQWDCGWYLLDKKWQRRIEPQFPLTHQQFHRMAKSWPKPPKQVLNQARHQKAHMDRRWGDWRRVCINKLYDHNFYGHGTIKWTDGVHCIFSFYNGQPEPQSKLVHITNLTEVKYPTVHNGSINNKIKKPKSISKTKRNLAIKVLTLTGKPTTEQNIKQLIDKLK